MENVTSRDGTLIAYERTGDGRPIIIATGIFNDHTRCAELAAELAAEYTVLRYDRRGRGQSEDTQPYAVEREVEDLDALIDLLGGPAAVVGYSSGAVLAWKAAADGSKISDLVLFEPPIGFDPADRAPADLPARIAALVDAGRPGDAVALTQIEGIGLPAQLVAQLRDSPMWPGLEAMARSAVYDMTITTAFAEVPAELTAVTTPTLILSGAQTWPKLSKAAHALADATPAATHREIATGQHHDIPPVETAQAVREFLSRRLTG
jgi:pimeloyl-ACP methyl ester carboxylesterase